MITLVHLRDFFFWSTILNWAILMIWFGMLLFAHDWVYRFHSRWFRLSVEQFDRINYAGLAAYKVGIILLNLVPFIAICLVRGRVL